jgi:hypothetical protein
MSDFDDFVGDVDKKKDKPDIPKKDPLKDDSKPKEEVQQPANGLTSFQKKELEALAQKYEAEIDEVLKIYLSNASDPAYLSISDINDRFRVLKGMVIIELEKKTKTEKRSMLILGKHVKAVIPKKEGDWEGVIINATVNVFKEEGGSEIMNISAFETPGTNIFKNIRDAHPLHSFKVAVGVNKDDSLELTEKSLFRNGLSPVDDHEYAHMNEIDMYKHFAGIELHNTIEEAGLSELDGNFPDSTDLKAVRILISKPTVIKRSKNEAFKDVFTWRADGTDMKGNPFVAKFPSFPEFSALVPEGRKAINGVAICTIGEFMGTINLDIYNWIPEV